MIFVEAPLPGAYTLDLEPRVDARGFFARAFCAEEFAAHGLRFETVQMNLSRNRSKGTLRGLHYQVAPAAEAKLVRCIRGAVHDVIVDVRPGSPTYLRHFAAELSAENRRALLVPEGFAHGFQTLTSGAEVLYQVTASYAPACERGLRYDDPALGIAWPLPVRTISEKDQAWPMLDASEGPE